VRSSTGHGLSGSETEEETVAAQVQCTMDVLECPDVSHMCPGRVVCVSACINAPGGYIAIQRGVVCRRDLTRNTVLLAFRIVDHGGAPKAHLIFAGRQTGLALEQLSKCADVAVADPLAHPIDADGP
jgi:hypothetical protein